MIPLLVAAAFCMPHEAVSTILEREHHEVVIGVALTADDKVMEVYVSPEGTWTITVTTPEGLSCILGTGEGWESVQPKVGEGA
ncbi:MAG: hypothetical protein VW338_00060 [Rhodospirillaceae bacterium]